jgi:hypothetical protein
MEAEHPTPADRGLCGDGATDLPLNPASEGFRMPPISEILFVDPAVSDLGTILGNLRPGVEAIVLDATTPPARQMAATLAGHEALEAVHIMAHGATGSAFVL